MRLRRRLTVASCTALSLLLAFISTAESSPYRTKLKLRGRMVSSVGEDDTGLLRVTGRLFGEGRIDVRFHAARTQNWKSYSTVDGTTSEERSNGNLILLKGTATVGRGFSVDGPRSFPASGTLKNGVLTISLPGKVKGSDGRRQRLYSIKVHVQRKKSSAARVSSIPNSLLASSECASHDGHVAAPIVKPLTAAALTSQANAYRVVTFSTDADHEWYQIHGERSNEVIASVLNAAEAIYERQFGLRFRIVRQHVYKDASPYNDTQPGNLLVQFANNPENPSNLSNSPGTFHDDVDVKHLFTGKDLMGGVVGIAYVGSVCATPSHAFGITQNFPIAGLSGIFAHELAHNFGASHDTEDRDGIMYPSISVPGPTRFSLKSQDEITRHLSAHGACLTTEMLPPLTPPADYTPAPPTTNVPNPQPTPSVRTPYVPTPALPGPSNAVLYLVKRRVGSDRRPAIKLSGKFVDYALHPYPGQPLRLIADGTPIAETMTNRNGSYRFFVRVTVPLGRRVHVAVETKSGAIRSNPLMLKRTNRRTHRRRSPVVMQSVPRPPASH